MDLAVALAVEKKDSAVLKYAIKSLSDKLLTDNAKKLAVQRIMHMSDVYPYLVRLMEDYVFVPFGVEQKQIKAYSDALYTDSIASHNYEAICFAIYFSLKHGFSLTTLDIPWVIQSGDCVLLMMTWVYYLKHNQNNRSATQLKPLVKKAKEMKEADMGRYWLFCYETLTIGNLEGEWKQLKREGISFLKEEFQ